jgi:hypothetical protein
MPTNHSMAQNISVSQCQYTEGLNPLRADCLFLPICLTNILNQTITTENLDDKFGGIWQKVGIATSKVVIIICLP